MSDFRNGQNLDGEHLKAQRKRFCAMAAEWTRHHADRLGVTEAELLAAIRDRGWLASDVEALASAEAYRFERSPVMATLSNAPIMPIVRDTESMERRRVRQVAGALKGAKAA